ncbi:MAG: NTP transferase domain-containing protein [Clostridia bacterium]|nr:NTP transferase domain-containing protein [Clostridia bacterium]
MKYNAVILAGGRGKRLMPMTERTPKPLVSIAGRSAFFRILDLLYAHGVTDCAVTVGYLAEKLMAKRHEHVKCTFFREEKPLGTAGGVKNAESMLLDTFIVISGDALCDFDLTTAVGRHVASGCRATILLTDCPAPYEYGTVDVGDDGCVRAFVEKPSPSQLVGTKTNSGIYILDRSLLSLIPDGAPFDFSEDLFPLMMSRGERINTVFCDGYWCDVGDLDAYFRCNRDAWEGKLRLYADARRHGVDVRLGRHSILYDAIINDGVSVGDRTRVYSSIICDGASIGRDCVIKSGCVIGEKAIIDDGVVLESGTHVSPEEHVFARCGTLLGGTTGIYNGVISLASPSPLFLVRLGHSLCALGTRIGIIASDDCKGEVVDSLVLGVRCAGAVAVELGRGDAADLRYAIRRLGCDGGIAVACDRGGLRLQVYDCDALPPTRKAERRIGERFLTEPSFEQVSEPQRERYSAAAGRREFLKRLELTLGAPAHEVGTDGDELTHPRYSHYELLYLALRYVSTVAGAIALFPNLPPKIYELMASRGCDVLTIAMTPTNERELYARTLAREQYYLRDGEVLRLFIGAYLRSVGRSLDEAVATDVPFSAVGEVLDSVDGNVPSLVGCLLKRQDCRGCREGVRMLFDDGEVLLTPTARGFKLIASATASETAAELCHTANTIIRSL